MTSHPRRFCLHLDCRLTRLRIRRVEGLKIFLLRCDGCGCTISTRSLRILKNEVNRLLHLGAPLPL
jgi:hypothetical protein